MLKSIKSIKAFLNFRPRKEPPPRLGDVPHDGQLATAILLHEITRADLRVVEAEVVVMEATLCDAFGVSTEKAGRLTREAAEAVNDKKAIDRASRIVNESFTLEQKRYLLELLWRVAFSDRRLERNEEYMVRKIARLLSMNHIDIMDAKLKAESAHWRHS